MLSVGVLCLREYVGTDLDARLLPVLFLFFLGVWCTVKRMLLEPGNNSRQSRLS